VPGGGGVTAISSSSGSRSFGGGEREKLYTDVEGRVAGLSSSGSRSFGGGESEKLYTEVEGGVAGPSSFSGSCSFGEGETLEIEVAAPVNRAAALSCFLIMASISRRCCPIKS